MTLHLPENVAAAEVGLTAGGTAVSLASAEPSGK